VSLRIRLMTSIAAVLLACLAIGSLLVYWHAIAKVETELRGALAVGARTVRNAIADGRAERLPRELLESLVTNFNGHRHLRASLIDNSGATTVVSSPLVPSEPAPKWFYRLLAKPSRVVRADLGVPTYRAILLEADPHNEIAEAWSDILVSLVVLVTFCGLILSLVYWTIGRALRPLDDLSAAFSRIGDGNYAPTMAAQGPRELAQLCGGFNHMANRLSEMEVKNRHLAEQLTIMQEEERSDLARDLHDEIGPMLFAVDVDLASMRQQKELRSHPAIAPRIDAIRAAVSQMQRHVRSILGRLRPPTLLDLGPAHAVDDLIAFWRTRYPAVVFDVSMPPVSFGPSIDEQIYRIIQESLNNALRHGHPQRIAITVRLNADDAIAVDISDDGGPQPTDRARFGLLGMQQRVQSLGGTLSAGNRHDKRGVIVSARLPYAANQPGSDTVAQKTLAV
jgi:two-component system, NarL family, sensor histidine kinase UhpB